MHLFGLGALPGCISSAHAARACDNARILPVDEKVHRRVPRSQFSVWAVYIRLLGQLDPYASWEIMSKSKAGVAADVNVLRWRLRTLSMYVSTTDGSLDTLRHQQPLELPIRWPWLHTTHVWAECAPGLAWYPAGSE
ncbi:hypothetical protein BD414DRAFT_284703 [Trametes punicea]|nr:hypothetical protein BD414DRAFT_284703 [Trametes punicea]